MASKNGKTGEAGKENKMTAVDEKTEKANEAGSETKVSYEIVSERSKKPRNGVVEILKQVNTQKQPVLNLDTQTEDTIEVKQCKFIVQEFDSEIHGNRADYDNAVFEAAKSLVQPAEKQTQALLEFAQSEVYYNSKRDALSSGNYMTQELKTQLIKMMKMRPALADLSSKEVFDRWEAGFAKGAAKAVEFLDQAKAALVASAEEDLGF